MTNAKKSPTLTSGASSKTGCNAIDKSTLTNKAEFVKLETVFNSLFEASKSVKHGIVSVELHIRDGQPWRYSLQKSESFFLTGGTA